MKEPSGELVELDFYFSDRSSADALRDIVVHCLRNGGTYCGQLLASQFPNARAAEFQGVYSSDVNVIAVGHEGLLRRLNDLNTRAVKIPVRSALGLTRDVPEIVTYSGVSQMASAIDTHPVAIVSEGWVFSTPGYERQAQKAGKRCYQKFIDVCTALAPDYAAILNEHSLPCRYDLGQGLGHECFCDFFVSFDPHDASVISELEAMFTDSYTERLRSGIFVSTTPVYNPEMAGIDRRTAFTRSKRVARLLKGM